MVCVCVLFRVLPWVDCRCFVQHTVWDRVPSCSAEFLNKSELPRSKANSSNILCIGALGLLGI